jgi:hypothetical protein
MGVVLYCGEAKRASRGAFSENTLLQHLLCDRLLLEQCKSQAQATFGLIARPAAGTAHAALRG